MYSPFWSLAAPILVLLTYIGFAWRTPVLCDRAAAPGPRTYSLARFQFAWWSALILGAFLYLGLSQGHFDGIVNASALALLGISAGTTATSAIVDAQPAAAAPAAAPAVRGFIYDMISDASGVNIHRLQMLLWTFALGAVFIVEVLGRHALPDFDKNVLVLSGVSSAAYLTLKTQES